MTFSRPEFLGLLAALPVCAFFAGLAEVRRRRIAAFFPGLSGVVPRRRLKAACFLLGMSLLALGAAGPQIGRETLPAAPPAGLRLAIALDCSRSMLARDLSPDRLGAAKVLLLDVLSRLPGIQAGLIGFSGQAWLACPVTADRAGLAGFLDRLSPAEAPLGGTSVPAALEASRLALAGAEAGAVLVVSDGEDTVPVRDAESPRAGDVPVFTVAVGGATPVPVPLATRAGGGVLRDASGAPVLVGVDAAGLGEVARENGGRAFRLAPDAPSPAAGIAAALASLVPPQVGQGTVVRPVDRSTLFYTAGWALLLFDLLLVPGGRAVALALALACVFAARPVLADTRAGAAVARGLAAFAAGQDKAALDAFLAARVWQPERPEILYDIATAAYRLGRFDRASELFGRAALAGAPGFRAKALYNQGNAVYRLGDADAAMRLYQAALALTPADADARANLEWLRARKKNGQAGEKQAAEPGPGPGKAPQPEAGGPGQADQPGQAPSPNGRDDGGGQARGEKQTAAAAQTAENRQAGQATVPVAARHGQKAGEKRARTAGASDDPILGRIPDLSGLPGQPHYGRPRVEKDW